MHAMANATQTLRPFIVPSPFVGACLGGGFII
jgi:hypothetical protein